MKKRDEIERLANNFVLTLNKAGYKFNHTKDSLRYIEIAINGLKKEKNSPKAIHAAYIYFAVYIAEIFVKDLPSFEIRLDFKNDEISDVMVTDGKSKVYFLTWMYLYMSKPKKEGILHKYDQTVRILSGKAFKFASN